MIILIIFFLVFFLKYTFFTFLSELRNFFDVAILNFFKISFSLKLALIVFFDCSLPFCLIPMFITGIFNEQASIIPLDEFPTKHLHFFRTEK